MVAGNGSKDASGGHVMAAQELQQADRTLVAAFPVQVVGSIIEQIVLKNKIRGCTENGYFQIFPHIFFIASDLFCMEMVTGGRIRRKGKKHPGLPAGGNMCKFVQPFNIGFFCNEQHSCIV